MGIVGVKNNMMALLVIVAYHCVILGCEIIPVIGWVGGVSKALIRWVGGEA